MNPTLIINMMIFKIVLNTSSTLESFILVNNPMVTINTKQEHKAWLFNVVVL